MGWILIIGFVLALAVVLSASMLSSAIDQRQERWER
jgi:hypothetical protein